MKAWRISSHGGREALKRVDIPKPQPGPGEACIRVQAVGLNHLDLWVRNGVPGHRFPLPLTPGCDCVGQVESLGPLSDSLKSSLESDGIRAGSDVIASPGISCGRCEACLGGFDPLCPQYGILGETRDGGCADFLVVPTANLIPRPKSLSIAEAAATPIPYLTAWTMLHRKAGLKPGEIVLVHAGGSGVSVAAIQLAKLQGATVITTVGNPEKAAKAAALGADHVIQYKAAPFREELKKILPAYGKKGVDIVVDHVGADTFGESLKSLVWGGKLVTCGATSGAQVSVDLKAVFFKNLSIHGTTMGSKADLLRIFQLIARGKLKPVVDSTLSMDDLPLAMDRLEARSAFGKIVLENR